MGTENYCECLVGVKTDSKYQFLTILCAALAVICAAAGMFLILIACVPAVVFGVLAWFLAQKIHTEFEYLLLDHEFSADIIYRKDRRKRLLNCPTKKIDLFAPADPGKIDHVRRQNMKLEDYSTKKDGDRHYLMTCSSENGKAAFLVTPNEQLLEMLGRELPRSVFTR